MSATFDKKTDTKSDKKTEKFNRREEREREEQRKRKRSRRFAIIFVAVFLVIVAAAVFISNSPSRRWIPAITIGEMDFSAAEFDFLYYRSYESYYESINSQWGEYAETYGLLPSSNEPHSRQIFDEETGQTWADFLIEQTIELVSGQAKHYKEAKAAGFTLSEKSRQAIEEELEIYRSYDQFYGSEDGYIRERYGRNVNSDIFRRMLEFMYISLEYGEYVTKSFEYSPQQLGDYYLENKDNRDSFEYRYILLTPETLDRDEFESDEEYDNAKEAALEDIRAYASEKADEIESEDDFINMAWEYDPMEYYNADSTLRIYPGAWLTDDDYSPWLRDEARQYGEVFSGDVTAGAFIVLFIERNSNEYYMPKMRQILLKHQSISPDSFDGGTGDPAYSEAVINAETETRELAQSILDQLAGAGGTEEKLLELMDEHSEDTTEGGYYENISRNQASNKMIKVIEDWLFAPERQYGDYELIRTEEYGYHLVFFMGFGDRYCDYLASEALREQDFKVWQENLPDVEVTKHWAFMFTSN